MVWERKNYRLQDIQLRPPSRGRSVPPDSPAPRYGATRSLRCAAVRHAPGYAGAPDAQYFDTWHHSRHVRRLGTARAVPAAQRFPGGHRGGEPPVPIPNTEVKPSTADGTAGAGLWESRSLPGLFLRSNARSTQMLRAFCRFRAAVRNSAAPRAGTAAETGSAR